jgi:iron complex outermembrane recepter protein
MTLKKLSYAMLYIFGCTALPGLAATTAPPEDTGEAGATAVPVVTVEGARTGMRQTSIGAASRLDLGIMETPASVEVIDQDVFEQRGARSLDEAVRGAVGMVQGGNPTSPSQTSARGFTSGFVSYLYDGTQVAVPTMSGRTQDAWNYERIEILKGPASVLYGEGAIGGAVNFVTKRPERGTPVTEALLAYGSFNTWRAAVGLNRAVGAASAVRIDFSHQQSDGYVERNRQRYDNLTMGFTTALTRDLRLDLSLDVLSDDVHAYEGTPLVPASFATEPTGVVSDSAGRLIDRRLISKNYNFDDAVMRADSKWARAKLSWQINPAWSLRNELSYYTAERRWRNSESYGFVAPRQLTRDLVGVTHEHDVWTDRLDLSYRGTLVGMQNRFVGGVEYTKTDFGAERRFSNGGAAANKALSVDILAPALGTYGDFSGNADLYAGAGNRTNFGTRIPTHSLFLEDALSLGSAWTVVGGARRDRVKLDRTIFDLSNDVTTAYGQRYDPSSFRLGLVYAFDRDTSLYAQTTNATAPVGSGNLLLLSGANAAFDLSHGRQQEAGIKQALFNGRLQYTLAVYKIALDNILSRDASVPTLTVNNGSQSSRGVELGAGWRIDPQWNVSGNVAWVDARFDRLIEAGNVSRAGNLPPNVAKRTANLWLDYQVAQSPLKVGAAANHVGDRYANNANTVKMNGYTTADVYATWRLSSGSLTLRVRNVADKLYASWTGANANNQVILGAPRSADLTYHARF